MVRITALKLKMQHFPFILSETLCGPDAAVVTTAGEVH